MPMLPDYMDNLFIFRRSLKRNDMWKLEYICRPQESIQIKNINIINDGAKRGFLRTR